MGNSILVLAWATVYVGTTPSMDKCATKLVLYGICALGGVMGPFFACLGRRGRHFLNLYLDQGTKMENDPNYVPKPFYLTEQLRDGSLKPSKPKRKGWFARFKGLCGSYFLLQAIPIAFTVLYGLLLYASWRLA